MTDQNRYTPAEFIAVQNHLRTLTDDDILAAGFIDMDAVLAVTSVRFILTLDDPGEKKIQCIKVIRTVTGLGLGEAKNLVDDAPSLIATYETLADANVALLALAEIGAGIKAHVERV